MPRLAPRGSRRSRLDGYREWIDAHIVEGFMNVAALHRQLTERGFRGSYASVYDFVTKRLGAIRALGNELTAALDLADGFADLIRKRSTATLDEWLARGEASPDPELRRFAEGIRREAAVVQAAITQTWSNRPVEGHVNRLKTIKRQIYGRAGFMLLRARVLNAA